MTVYFISSVEEGIRRAENEPCCKLVILELGKATPNWEKDSEREHLERWEGQLMPVGKSQLKFIQRQE